MLIVNSRNELEPYPKKDSKLVLVSDEYEIRWRPSKSIRKEIRDILHLHQTCNYPIFLVNSQSATVAGTRYHWTNGRGDIINSPGSYRHYGWSSMKYVPSSRKIQIGYWLARKNKWL